MVSALYTTHLGGGGELYICGLCLIYNTPRGGGGRELYICGLCLIYNTPRGGGSFISVVSALYTTHLGGEGSFISVVSALYTTHLEGGGEGSFISVVSALYTTHLGGGGGSFISVVSALYTTHLGGGEGSFISVISTLYVTLLSCEKFVIRCSRFNSYPESGSIVFHATFLERMFGEYCEYCNIYVPAFAGINVNDNKTLLCLDKWEKHYFLNSIAP